VAASFAEARSDQEFAISFRPGDRARLDAEDGPAWEGGPPVADGAAQAGMEGWIAHDAAGADLTGAGFELRFDQGYAPGARGAVGERGWEEGAQADEACIADQGLDWFA
jgi:hypothetical protein